jgi:hypothetical protein
MDKTRSFSVSVAGSERIKLSYIPREYGKDETPLLPWLVVFTSFQLA